MDVFHPQISQMYTDYGNVSASCHAERSEASHTQRKSRVSRVRFLAALGMT
jgi:hypothetical protein